MKFENFEVLTSLVIIGLFCIFFCYVVGRKGAG